MDSIQDIYAFELRSTNIVDDCCIKQLYYKENVPAIGRHCGQTTLNTVAKEAIWIKFDLNKIPI
jgi:hypothetical protein